MTMARFRAVSARTRNSQTHIPMETQRPSGAKFLGGSRAETDHNPQAKNELKRFFPGAVSTSQLSATATATAERLLKTILMAETRPNDIVLDPGCNCRTSQPSLSIPT
jgi:hypothetical protein